MATYSFAEIAVEISTDNKYIIDRISTFLTSKSRPTELKVDLIKSDIIKTQEGVVLLDDDIKWLKKESPDGGYTAYITVKGDNHVWAALDLDEKWENATIDYRENIAINQDRINISDYISFQSIGIIIKNKLLFNDGIVIHASSIEHEGKGILFSAPSGTGKSTHVNLWEKYKENVLVMNDDAPALRIIEGKTYLYGTPWSGSSDKFLNRRAPLAAMVVLEQAPENSIQLLAKTEAAARLMPRMLLPYFDEGMMARAIDIFDRIITDTPVYLLKCRPDKEAVELVYGCLTKKYDMLNET